MPKTLIRRMFVGLLIVIAWLGFVVEGTHAVLNSTASLTGNTISTGSLSLLVSNSQSASSTTYAQSRAGFNLTLAPGQYQETYMFLKNASQGSASFDIDAMASVQADNPALAAAVMVEVVSVDSAGVVNGTPVSASLADMATRHVQIPVVIPTSGIQRLKLKFTLLSSYTDSNQTIGYDLVFTGTQRS